MIMQTVLVTHYALTIWQLCLVTSNPQRFFYEGSLGAPAWLEAISRI